MGKKKKNKRNKNKHDDFPIDDEDQLMGFDLIEGSKKLGAKAESRRRKKLRKQLEKQKRDRKTEVAPFTGWHTITVEGVGGMTKLDILRKIGEYVEEQFQPIGFRFYQPTIAKFFLESNLSATESIASLDRRLTGLNNEKLRIKMNRVISVCMQLREDKAHIFKEVLARRYNPETSLLDLTNLHLDPVFIEKDILAPLESPFIFKAAMDIIRENIPHIKAINFSHNKLRNLIAIKYLKPSSPLGPKIELMAVNLESNCISDRRILATLKDFPVEELNLQNNPILDNIKNPFSYISMIHKELPNLKILDKVNIVEYLQKHGDSSKSAVNNSTPVSGIAVNSTPVPGIAVTEESIKTFLEQYYALFITPERYKLIQAYTPTAKFEVRSEGTNLNGTFDGPEKIKLALSDLPIREHVPNTFNLKILNTTGTDGIVQVTAVCVLNDDRQVHAKRTMKIIQFNQGLCCSEDLLELIVKS